MPDPTRSSSKDDMFTERPVVSALSGCSYAVFVIGISALMLLVNALFCLTIYSVLPNSANEQIASRVGQLFYFIVPVLLMIVEWNVLDRLGRLFRG